MLLMNGALYGKSILFRRAVLLQPEDLKASHGQLGTSPGLAVTGEALRHSAS